MPDASQHPPTLSEAALQQVAVAYLARYSATSTTLARMLNRHIDRWARTSGGDDVATLTAAAKRLVRDVVASLAAAGAVDDASFAAARSRRLRRTGHSRLVTAAHLAARGVSAEIVANTLPDDAGAEVGAALAYLRRRRLGPFGAAPADAAAPDRRRRELGALARAGFARDTAETALDMTRDAADAVLARLRQG
jgi:regulatory protein